MRLFVILACLAVAVVVTLMILVWEESSHQPESVASSPAATKEMPHVKQPAQHADLETTADRQDESIEKENEQPILKLGQEFEQRWYKDREKLGIERHREMEKLWFDGRRPRGDPQSIARLLKLLDDFPDTNRAGCAAYELGHHYLHDRQLDNQERQRQAEKYWRLVSERYRDTLCEYNSPADAMAKVSLVTWVYRYTDKALAKQILEELMTQHPGETNHLGQPIDQVAKQLLEVINKE